MAGPARIPPKRRPSHQSPPDSIQTMMCSSGSAVFNASVLAGQEERGGRVRHGQERVGAAQSYHFQPLQWWMAGPARIPPKMRPSHQSPPDSIQTMMCSSGSAVFNASVLAGQEERGGRVRHGQEGVGAAQSYHFKPLQWWMAGPARIPPKMRPSHQSPPDSIQTMMCSSGSAVFNASVLAGQEERGGRGRHGQEGVGAAQSYHLKPLQWWMAGPARIPPKMRPSHQSPPDSIQTMMCSSGSAVFNASVLAGQEERGGRGRHGQEGVGAAQSYHLKPLQWWMAGPARIPPKMRPSHQSPPDSIQTMMCSSGSAVFNASVLAGQEERGGRGRHGQEGVGAAQSYHLKPLQWWMAGPARIPPKMRPSHQSPPDSIQTMMCSSGSAVFNASVLAGQEERGGRVRHGQEGVGAAQSYHLKPLQWWMAGPARIPPKMRPSHQSPPDSIQTMMCSSGSAVFNASVLAGQEERGGRVRHGQEGVGAAQSYHLKPLQWWMAGPARIPPKMRPSHQSPPDSIQTMMCSSGSAVFNASVLAGQEERGGRGRHGQEGVGAAQSYHLKPLQWWMAGPARIPPKTTPMDSPLAQWEGEERTQAGQDPLDSRYPR